LIEGNYRAQGDAERAALRVLFVRLRAEADWSLGLTFPVGLIRARTHKIHLLESVRPKRLIFVVTQL
jgi:hypothetical protein